MWGNSSFADLKDCDAAGPSSCKVKDFQRQSTQPLDQPDTGSSYSTDDCDEMDADISDDEVDFMPPYSSHASSDSQSEAGSEASAASTESDHSSTSSQLQSSDNADDEDVDLDTPAAAMTDSMEVVVAGLVEAGAGGEAEAEACRLQQAHRQLAVVHQVAGEAELQAAQAGEVWHARAYCDVDTYVLHGFATSHGNGDSISSVTACCTAATLTDSNYISIAAEHTWLQGPRRLHSTKAHTACVCCQQGGNT